jgi:patatin-like phospholipase/acyl hydrolase
MNQFKILSIDGGGFRGIFAAHILKRIEEEFSFNWLKGFDLIAGTSTGSIIAAGLVVGMTANDIFSLYEKHGGRIFHKSFYKLGLFSSQYNNVYLKRLLKDVFGDRKLGDYSYPLIVPSTDIGAGKVHVFKSGYDTGFVRDKKVYVRDAVLASCSAPTFFNPHTVDSYLLSDGGLWANNPSLVAVIDAQKRLGINSKDIKVFSLGTGVGNVFYSQKNKCLSKLFGWGFLTRWERERLIEMILNLQSETANNMIGLLLATDQIMRINFESDRKLPIDDIEMQKDLQSRADRYFTHNSEKIKSFLEIGG